MAGIGGTVSDLLDVMKLLNNELKVVAAGKDETRAILALSMAQHYFESIAASIPKVLQSTVNVATTANQETTTWTSSLLRLDAMWLLDENSRPVRKLEKVDAVGGHVPSLPWPLAVVSFASGGPFAYYGNMANFYWMGTPESVKSLRIYGFIEQSEFAARTSDFNYPKRTKLALADFAVKVLRIGLDDAGENSLDQLAVQIFTPLLRQLRKPDRSGPEGRHYDTYHST